MANKNETELKRLAKRLGGGWRIEKGIMPVIVLSLTEAQKLEKRLNDQTTNA